MQSCAVGSSKTRSYRAVLEYRHKLGGSVGQSSGGSSGRGGDVGLGLPVGFLLGVLEGGNARGLQGLVGAHWLGSPE